MLAAKRALRLLTDPTYIRRVTRYALGLPTPVTTEDRRLLEQVIFPHYANRDDVRTVLFVGCQWYTRHYEKTYFPTQIFWTIDPARDARRYGGHNHVIAPLEQLADFFPEEMFDLIVCNGVYGWGLNSKEQCEAAFAQSHSRLRPGGHFVFGWNDVPAFTPVPLTTIASLALFRPTIIPEFGTSRVTTETELRHVFDFYCR